MKRTVLTTLVASFAIVSAPAASAAPDDVACGKRGGASKCQKPGHSSLHTEPEPPPLMPSGRGLVQPGWMPGYGGPAFPVID